MLNLSQKNKIVDLALVLMVFVFAFEVLFYHSAVVNGLIYFVENSGIWSWVVISVLQFLQVVFIPIPAYFITLTSMKMYPDQMVLLFVVTLSVVMLGVITAYCIGRKWGKKAVVWAAGSEEEYEKWLNVLQSKKTNLFYFLTVLLPIFPDDILCLLAGSIKMNFWWFLLCNFVGRAIGLVTFMFVFTNIGGGLTSIVVFGIIIIILIVYKIILKRRLKNEHTIDRQ